MLTVQPRCLPVAECHAQIGTRVQGCSSFLIHDLSYVLFLSYYTVHSFTSILLFLLHIFFVLPRFIPFSFISACTFILHLTLHLYYILTLCFLSFSFSSSLLLHLSSLYISGLGGFWLAFSFFPFLSLIRLLHGRRKHSSSQHYLLY